MKLFVTGRQMDVTPAARQQIEKKLARLERLLNDSALSPNACFRSNAAGWSAS